MAAKDWFAEPSKDVQGYVLAVPSAGAGSSVFAPLTEKLLPDVEVLTARLPLRERRVRDAMPDSLGDIAEELVDWVENKGVWPYVILGLCSGSVLAFECVRHIQTRGLQLPLALTVCSHTAGAGLGGRPAAASDEAKLRRWLMSVTELPEGVSIDAYFELVLPALRADLSLLDAQRDRQFPGSVAVDVLGFFGRDDPRIPADRALSWLDKTERSVRLEFLPNVGHGLVGGWGHVARSLLALFGSEQRVRLDADAAGGVEDD